jgi:hypothetical protein
MGVGCPVVDAVGWLGFDTVERMEELFSSLLTEAPSLSGTTRPSPS